MSIFDSSQRMQDEAEAGAFLRGKANTAEDVSNPVVDLYHFSKRIRLGVIDYACIADLAHNLQYDIVVGFDL